MPDGPGEGQTVKVVRNGEGGTKRGWKLATRNQAPSGRAPHLDSSEQGRGRPSGLRCRTPWASVQCARRGSRRTIDGWSPMVRPHGEARRWNGADATFGELPHRTADGLVADRTRWVAAGRQGIAPGSSSDEPESIRVDAGARTSVPAPVWTPGDPHGPSARVIARRRPSCHRTPAVPLWTDPPGLDLRSSRQPIRRSSGSGRRTAGFVQDAGEPPSGGRSVPRGTPVAWTTQGSGSGK